MIDDRLSWRLFVVMTYEYMTTASPDGGRTRNISWESIPLHTFLQLVSLAQRQKQVMSTCIYIPTLTDCS
jgi:hypothetical protein